MAAARGPGRHRAHDAQPGRDRRVRVAAPVLAPDGLGESSSAPERRRASARVEVVSSTSALRDAAPRPASRRAAAGPRPATPRGRRRTAPASRRAMAPVPVRTPSRITGSRSGSASAGPGSSRSASTSLRVRATPACARAPSPCPPRASAPGVRRCRRACRPSRRTARRPTRPSACRCRTRPAARLSRTSSCDLELVQAAAREDAHLREPRLVEQLRGRRATSSVEVAAVQPHAEPSRSARISRTTSIAFATPFSVSYVSTRNVVRSGMVLGERAERLDLRRERLDERVRHRAGDLAARTGAPPRRCDVAANPTIALSRATAIAASTPVRAPEREVHQVRARPRPAGSARPSSRRSCAASPGSAATSRRAAPPGATR